MSGDQVMRELGDSYPVPEFDSTSWTTPPRLEDATVAIVTSAAIHSLDDDRFAVGDTGYRIVDRERRDLVLGHWSPNFDRAGLTADLNVAYPADRLEELAADGTIGGVGPHHLAFMGAQDETMATIRVDTGPAAATLLRGDAVDVVLLTPV